MGKRMAMWSEKHLSAAAKEVLIKAVAHAIPTYTMSIFHLSASFCEGIGGERILTTEEHIGLHGKNLPGAKLEVDWVFGTFRFLIKLC